MKVLNITETAAVSGGDYELTLKTHVGSGVGGWMTDLVSQIVNGNINTPDGFGTWFMNALNNGARFQEVRIESFEITHFD